MQEILMSSRTSVPPQDYAALEATGVGAVLGPGTRITEAARRVLELLTPEWHAG